MMMLLALPQPGPPLVAPVMSAARAETACSSSIEPRLMPEQPRPADAEDVAPGHPELRVAQVFPSLSGDDDHRVAPGWGVGGLKRTNV